MNVESHEPILTRTYIVCCFVLQDSLPWTATPKAAKRGSTSICVSESESTSTFDSGNGSMNTCDSAKQTFSSEHTHTHGIWNTDLLSKSKYHTKYQIYTHRSRSDSSDFCTTNPVVSSNQSTNQKITAPREDNNATHIKIICCCAVTISIQQMSIWYKYFQFWYKL